MVNCVSILGSTGSIGRQTLDIVEHLGVAVGALTAGTSVERMAQQCRRFRPKLAVMATEEAALALKKEISDLPTEVDFGEAGLIRAAELEEAAEPEETVEPEEAAEPETIMVHQHTEECYETVLICELEEHVHDDVCYADASLDKALEFLCGFGTHHHDENCINGAGESICSIPEHAHSAACVVADLDMNADVETEADWSKMFRDTELPYPSSSCNPSCK